MSEDPRRPLTDSLAIAPTSARPSSSSLSLGGLSNPETARRGNLFGMIGMALAVLATVLGPRVTPAGYRLDRRRPRRRRQRRPARREEGADDADAPARRADAQPRRPGGVPGRLRELRRHLHGVRDAGAEKAIHEVEIYLGILIGAVTFSGSIVAFGKLSARSAASRCCCRRGHWINLAGLLVVIWFGHEVPRRARPPGRHDAAGGDDGRRAAVRHPW